jgi:hypothetical protein
MTLKAWKWRKFQIKWKMNNHLYSDHNLMNSVSLTLCCSYVCKALERTWCQILILSLVKCKDIMNVKIEMIDKLSVWNIINLGFQTLFTTFIYFNRTAGW